MRFLTFTSHSKECAGKGQGLGGSISNQLMDGSFDSAEE